MRPILLLMASLCIISTAARAEDCPWIGSWEHVSCGSKCIIYRGQLEARNDGLLPELITLGVYDKHGLAGRTWSYVEPEGTFKLKLYTARRIDEPTANPVFGCEL